MARYNKIWTTKLVNEALQKIESGDEVDLSCFWNQDTGFRAADINFQMTQEETEEFIKCSENVIYFANKYCYAMTDDGIANINLRDYQRDMLRDFQKNRFIIMLASRQIGKCLILNTLVKIKNKQTNEITELPIFEFRHLILKDKLKTLSPKMYVIYKIKYHLYKLYNKLDK